MESTSKALLDLINSSTATITAAYASAGLPFPDVNNPVRPADPAVSSQPAVFQAAQTLAAATSQLVASVRVPQLYLLEKALSFHISHSMRTAIEAHAAEALRDAGVQGLHVTDIAKYSVIDASKLGRVLRLLTTQYLFQEVQPNVFAATSLTRIMDTGKPPEVFNNLPRTAWYDGTNGIAALIAHSADEVLKSAAYLPDAFQAAQTAASPDLAGSGMALAFSTNKSYFEWLESSEDGLQKERLERFAMAMVGTKALLGQHDSILGSIGWEALPKDSVVVDCGAGVGTHTLTVFRGFPDLKYIVQDRPDVIKQAESWWKEQMPDAVESGRVTLLAHDFFTPQPVKEASIYFFRFVIHDWPDHLAMQILKHIRAACAPSSRLVLIEQVILLGCPVPSSSIDGSVGAGFPPPLAAHGGPASYTQYGTDMQMAALMNAKERTLPMWTEIIVAAGFNIESLTGGESAVVSYIICAPA